MTKENEVVEDVVEEVILEEENITGEQDICFVIMPFGGYYDSYYREIYRQAIIDAGLIPIRADDLFRHATIVKEIWEVTKSAKILLADLSGKNPNVMYELGLAHAITKPAVLITENIEDVPFDLRALRVLEYDKHDSHWGEKLQATITQAIKEVLKNPAAAVPAPFLDVDTSRKLEVTEVEKRLLEMQQDIDMLKKGRLSQTEYNITLTEQDEIRKFIVNGIKLNYSYQQILNRLLEIYEGRIQEQTLINFVSNEHRVQKGRL